MKTKTNNKRWLGLAGLMMVVARQQLNGKAKIYMENELKLWQKTIELQEEKE